MNKNKTPNREKFRIITNHAVSEWVQADEAHRASISILAESETGVDGGRESMTVGGNQVLLQNALLNAFMVHHKLAEIVGEVVDEYRRHIAEMN